MAKKIIIKHGTCRHQILLQSGAAHRGSLRVDTQLRSTRRPPTSEATIILIQASSTVAWTTATLFSPVSPRFLSGVCRQYRTRHILSELHSGSRELHARYGEMQVSLDHSLDQDKIVCTLSSDLCASDNR